MAKATRINQPSVSLELTSDEVDTLLCICNKIGGNPRFTRRGHIDNIRAALISAGYVSRAFGSEGSIYFNE